MSRRVPNARTPSTMKARKRNPLFRRGLRGDGTGPPLPFRFSGNALATNPPCDRVSPDHDHTHETTSHRTDGSHRQWRFRPSDVGFVSCLILFEMAPYSIVWVCPPPF